MAKRNEAARAKAVRQAMAILSEHHDEVFLMTGSGTASNTTKVGVHYRSTNLSVMDQTMLSAAFDLVGCGSGVDVNVEIEYDTSSSAFSTIDDREDDEDD